MHLGRNRLGRGTKKPCQIPPRAEITGPARSRPRILDGAVQIPRRGPSEPNRPAPVLLGRPPSPVRAKPSGASQQEGARALGANRARTPRFLAAPFGGRSTSMNFTNRRRGFSAPSYTTILRVEMEPLRSEPGCISSGLGPPRLARYIPHPEETSHALEQVDRAITRLLCARVGLSQPHLQSLKRHPPRGLKTRVEEGVPALAVVVVSQSGAICVSKRNAQDNIAARVRPVRMSTSCYSGRWDEASRRMWPEAPRVPACLRPAGRR